MARRAGPRCRTAGGRYTLADVYPHADLVTYRSSIEGFGNAFLEAVYHRRPIVVNRYSIYEIDIAPRGFRVVEFDGYISAATVAATRRLLDDPALAAAWAETNYALAPPPLLVRGPGAPPRRAAGRVLRGTPP